MNGRRDYEQPSDGQRRSAPAAQRNRRPIAEVLTDWLPKSGLVLEIASGTGEHAVFFAERFVNLQWQPSDQHPAALSSIAAWRDHSTLPNLLAPIALDSSSDDWPVDRADVIFNANMAHISPWAATLGLVAGAARLLPPGGPLILYGPWLKEDLPTAPSNLEFDADLRGRDPEWGLRRVEDLESAASAQGLSMTEWRQMPANNLMLLFRRRS